VRLGLSFDKVTGSAMSAFWRGLPAVNKIKTYLMGMVSSGYGLDTAMPPAATLYLLAC
jgi:hypothetical protein